MRAAVWRKPGARRVRLFPRHALAGLGQRSRAFARSEARLARGRHVNPLTFQRFSHPLITLFADLVQALIDLNKALADLLPFAAELLIFPIRRLQRSIDAWPGVR